ncbi:MAG: metal-dependent transcriptional regulator [Candidatus Bathyarchaeia archaeon]
MKAEASIAMEEYLENIYKLQERNGSARTKELAARMQVSLGTITNTVEILESRGFIRHEPYKGVKLTEEGRRIALNVVRRHRLAERLITDVLRVGWDKAHEAACKLEHGLDDEIIKPLEKALGHPKTCPHGNPIPTKCGGIIEEESRPLIELKLQEQGTVAKIVDEKCDLLKHLHSIGLMPGVFVKVKEVLPSEGSVVVEVGGVSRTLSQELASVVWVKKG